MSDNERVKATIFLEWLIGESCVSLLIYSSGYLRLEQLALNQKEDEEDFNF